jgi:peptide chain release factor 2
MRENIAGLLEELQQRTDAVASSLRLDDRTAELAELESKMNATDFWDDPDAANAVIGEMKAVKAMVEPVQEVKQAVDDAVLLWEMAEEADDDDTREEVDQQLDKLEKQVDQLETRSLLSGKYDGRNAYLSIQSGAGGTEADDWAEMLMRMYLYYFEQQGWDVSEVSKTHGTEAGLKEVTLFVKGPLVFGYLSTERGTHRLARVSPFNAEGKRQTSFATVDVIPEFPDTGGIEIPEKDLEIIGFARSSGPGGQNVNKVATAVRLTHIPTGIQVVSSTHKSQEQNRKQAIGILRGKLELQAEQERQAELDKATGGKVDMGWGTQIRSYVFYDNRVKDHRTGHEVGNPQTVMDGDLQGFIDAELERRAKIAGAA